LSGFIRPSREKKEFNTLLDLWFSCINWTRSSLLDLHIPALAVDFAEIGLHGARLPPETEGSVRTYV
jgi:hypothetical protein